MAVTNFIPTLWTARLLVALRKASVATALVNRDYEGEIRQGGDTVKITSVNDLTIGDYSVNTDITIETLTDATRSLVIDQQKYFAFQLDDVDAAQAKSGGALLAQATDNGAFQLKDTADAFLFSTMNAAVIADTTNDLSTTVVTADGAAYEAIVDLGVALDESNVPSDGRWVVVPPKFHGLLLKDQRFVSAGDDMAAATRANGRIGEAAGFQVYKSNNLPAATGAEVTAGAVDKVALAGYSGATTFAEQIVNMEADRMEKRFADLVKGLHVYGAKVTRAAALARIAIDATA
jgi:N4-gp56 family major capsid protein